MLLVACARVLVPAGDAENPLQARRHRLLIRRGVEAREVTPPPLAVRLRLEERSAVLKREHVLVQVVPVAEIWAQATPVSAGRGRRPRFMVLRL